MNHFDKYSELIAKQLAGQASPNELQELSAWAASDPAHQQYVEDLSEAWALAGEAPAAPFEPDLDAAWLRIEAGIGEGQDQAPATQPEPIVRAIYPGRQGRHRLWAAAAAIALCAVAAWWLLGKTPTLAAPELVEVKTGTGQKQAITLPDGSEVWLNENSRLAYAPIFEARNVVLEGEAFFEVEKMPNRPFEITTGGATTTVLGTSFNVRAYPAEGKVEVTVKTGKVALAQTKRKESPVYIAPGESGVFDKQSEKVTVAVKEIENADSWKTLRLSFDDEKMADVITSLERYFGVEIETENPLILDCPYTSSFEEPNLDHILTIIGSTIGFEFTAQGNRYVLSGKGCAPSN